MNYFSVKVFYIYYPILEIEPIFEENFFIEINCEHQR